MMSRPHDDLGPRLREARIRAGLTQEELAARIGYRSGRVQIHRIETGQRTPPMGERRRKLLAFIEEQEAKS